MIDWKQIPKGFQDRRYEIVLEAPSRWLLTVAGKAYGRYPTASDAKVEAERLEQRRSGNFKLGRLGVALGIVLALSGVVGAARIGPSTDREAAETIVARIDAAYAAMGDGSASVGDFTGASTGVRGVHVVLDDGERFDTLAGQAGDECYVLYWSPTCQRTARAMDVGHGVPCDAGVALGLWNLEWGQSGPDWGPVLPSTTKERVWFIPAVVLLLGVGLSLFTRLIVVFMTSRRR